MLIEALTENSKLKYNDLGFSHS